MPPELIVELSSLPASIKKRAMAHLTKSQQPQPHDIEAIRIKLQQETDRAQEIASHAALYMAQAQKAMADAGTAGMPDGAPAQQPPQIDTAADPAKANLDLAKAKQIYSELQRPYEPGALPEAQAQTAKALRDQAEARRTAIESFNLARFGAAEPARIPQPKPPGGPDAF